VPIIIVKKEPAAPVVKKKPIVPPKVIESRPKSVKSRPVTAHLPKSITTTSLQSRTQRVVPIVLPSTNKTRSKPTMTVNRRSSIGANLSPITSNLERQSTSTGGSTSSLSSTNTQASIPSTIAILRSISSPNTLNIHSKSRIPIAIGKKSSK